MKKIFLLIFILSSCARAPLKNIEDTMRPVEKSVYLSDQLSSESFFQALRKHIDSMKTSALISDPMIFGKKKIEKRKYIESLEEIFNHQEDWISWISNNFEFYEVYGREDWAEVLSTGYYEPKIKGSRVPTTEFQQALYSLPSDLVTVNLKLFSSQVTSSAKSEVLQGRVENQSLIPYHDRKAIDEESAIKDKSSVLAWVNPIDAFFLQIQGSGHIEFADGQSLHVGYAGQNGHSYVAIGKYLKHVIPIEEMSMQRIKLHLDSLSPKEQQEILNLNPSYVFFKELIGGEAMTYSGIPVSEGRTIATDQRFFPKGAMAFLDINEPEFDDSTSITPRSWKKAPRIVFDQDTGGAIRGGGRVDLYFGVGDLAAQKAGVMKQEGKLYYLVPKL